MKYFLLLALAVSGCGDDSKLGQPADLSVIVDPNRDASVAAPDFGPDPNAILGTFVGPCGDVLGQLHSPSPSLIDDTVRFVAGEQYVRSSLSPDGQTLYDIPNAGGSSEESEIMSLEVLHYCDGAALLKSETEIGYTPPDVDAGGNIITDILVQMGPDKVGVSVTRAYQPGGDMTTTEIHDLLVKKLDGINHSSARVVAADRWVKQILHVFVATQTASDAISAIWPTLDANLRADTIVLVTYSPGGGFIFCHPTPPLGQDCQ